MFLQHRGARAETRAHAKGVVPLCLLESPFLAPLQDIFQGFAKGWFPKGWFWRMFPRNENRNESTFATTTLLETALLSPNDPFWC